MLKRSCKPVSTDRKLKVVNYYERSDQPKNRLNRISGL